MKTARLNALRTLAATVAVTLSSSLAQAGHYGELDDHAREIYYEAGRADRVIRYNFRSAPLSIYTCLRENLCGMVETARCVNDLTRRSGNLEQIQEHVENLDDQFTEVQKGTEALRKWIAQCPAPAYSRFGSCSSSRSSVDEFNLRRLCERIEDIGKEMQCMLTDLDKLLVDAGIDARPHRHDHDPRNSRPADPRDLRPADPRDLRPADPRDRGPVNPRRLDVPPTPSSRSFNGFGRDRVPHGRAVQVPIFRHDGKSFSLSLRF